MCGISASDNFDSQTCGSKQPLNSCNDGGNTMATMTIRLPDGKHERLRLLAERQGVSLNKLVEEWGSVALAQFDAEIRFQSRSARGRSGRGLTLLDKLDAALTKNAETPRKKRH